MKKIIAGLVALVVSCSAVHAGGRGGHITRFDPNSYGGNWTNFITDLGAICDGNNSAADIAALNMTTSNMHLYIPPGSKCNFDVNNKFGFSGTGSPIVWGYGASVDYTFIGGSSFFNDETHSCLIQQVTAGDQTVTAVAPCNPSTIFNVGDWVYVGGLSQQTGSTPLNLGYCEFRRVTNVTSTTVTLNSPLNNNLLTTWPVTESFDVGGLTGGPAKIFLLHSDWGVTQRWFGLTITSPAQVNVIGRDLQLTDIVFQDLSVAGNGHPAPSYSASIFWTGGNIWSAELDKCLTITLNNVTATNFYVQSASDSTLNISNSYIPILDGSVKHLNVTNSRIFIMHPSPAGYGHNLTTNLDGVFIDNQDIFGTPRVPNSALSYNSGRFSVSTTNACVIEYCVYTLTPGQKYYFGAIDCSNDSVPQTHFTVSAISESGGNVNVDTSDWVQNGTPISTPSGTSVPSVLCQGGSVQCPNYCAYLGTVKQINSPAGSQTVTQYASPNP